MSRTLLPLLLSLMLALASAHNCQAVGSSALADVSACQVLVPAPRLKWSLNVTLKQDYDWRGADESKYFYLANDDSLLDETCYTGQTIKGSYKAGTVLQVEQLCFNFTPAMQKGDKLYLLLFWDRPQSEKLAVYISFEKAGQMSVESGEEVKQRVANLLTE